MVKAQSLGDCNTQSSTATLLSGKFWRKLQRIHVFRWFESNLRDTGVAEWLKATVLTTVKANSVWRGNTSSNDNERRLREIVRAYM